MSKELIDIWNEQDGTKKLKEILEVLKDLDSKMKFLNFGLELIQKEKEREQ